jgi:hypothetical protein
LIEGGFALLFACGLFPCSPSRLKPEDNSIITFAGKQPVRYGQAAEEENPAALREIRHRISENVSMARRGQSTA